MEDVAIETHRNMWFLHDGTPSDFGVNVRAFKNQRVYWRRLGHGGSIAPYLKYSRSTGRVR